MLKDLQYLMNLLSDLGTIDSFSIYIRFNPLFIRLLLISETSLTIARGDLSNCRWRVILNNPCIVSTILQRPASLL